MFPLEASPPTFKIKSGEEVVVKTRREGLVFFAQGYTGGDLVEAERIYNAYRLAGGWDNFVFGGCDLDYGK